MVVRSVLLTVSLLLAASNASALKCPFLSASIKRAAESVEHPAYAPRGSHDSFDQDAVSKLDIDGVKADLRAFFTDSKDWWPADWGHYGPFMVRLAWHCSGSYRTSDGRGGCDGARQRFDPERSWMDNTNLDKARSLLWPIKEKYGDALTWGDLIILAGDTAIQFMGGPILGFCAGRIDDMDGSASLPLGPTSEQEAVAPCPVDGDCESPLGATTLGLIYVNPEGPEGVPDPEKSAPQIRDTFGRMGMNDSETVALIGGGHAFGKAHGACPSGPGPSPEEQPWNPWPGTCGTGPDMGKGPNTFTSGFEGPWTSNPIGWDNEYFKNLLEYDWEVHVGPGGLHQWRPVRRADDPSTDPLPAVMMLTSDVALLKDPSYLELVKKYAEDMIAFDIAFSHAWYKLTTRDMGPATRCLGPLVPPPQPFQAPLPPAPAKKPDYGAVARDIAKVMKAASPSLVPDLVHGKSYYGAMFVTLAWQCASSFRQTDYSGGCNGARIRFAPQKDWPANRGLDKVLEVLEPVKSWYPLISYADLIVLAGAVAIKGAGGRAVEFCGGRVDADPNEPPLRLTPPRTFSNKLVQLRDNMAVMGLEPREMVALQARPRSPVQQQRLGYSGSWTTDPSRLTNDYFKLLLNEQWQNSTSVSGLLEMQAVGKPLYLLPTDLAIKWDAELAVIAQEFATNEASFLKTFDAAWNKMMIADRFDGPARNVCDREAAVHLLSDALELDAAAAASVAAA